MPVLISLPDVKACHKNLTLSKDYEIVREIGNGVVIVTDDPDLSIILLATRFETNI